MTIPENKLHRQLEQATARQVSPDDSLDAETASLRQTWLSLTELLEAAQPDEPVTLRVRDTEPAGHPARSRRWGLLTAVLAASVLVAITATWVSYRGGRTVSPMGQDTPPRMMAAQPSTTPAAEVGTTANVLKETASVAWDDALDQRLLEAWQRVQDVRSHEPMIDAIHSTAWGSAYQMQQELAGDETL